MHASIELTEFLHGTFKLNKKVDCFVNLCCSAKEIQFVQTSDGNKDDELWLNGHDPLDNT